MIFFKFEKNAKILSENFKIYFICDKIIFNRTFD